MCGTAGSRRPLHRSRSSTIKAWTTAFRAGNRQDQLQDRPTSLCAPGLDRRALAVRRSPTVPVDLAAILRELFVVLSSIVEVIVGTNSPAPPGGAQGQHRRHRCQGRSTARNRPALGIPARRDADIGAAEEVCEVEAQARWTRDMDTTAGQHALRRAGFSGRQPHSSTGLINDFAAADPGRRAFQVLVEESDDRARASWWTARGSRPGDLADNRHQRGEARAGSWSLRNECPASGIP